MNEYWEGIRKHYAKASVFILRAKKNELAIDPYAWNGIVEMTPIERALWCDIRAANAVLYPQYPIGRFIVDFANPKAKVVVECDGRAFHQDKAKDAARDAQLVSDGWVVYRAAGAICVTDQNQETGESSAARRFIDVICENHGIALKEKPKTIKTFQESIGVYIDTLIGKQS